MNDRKLFCLFITYLIKYVLSLTQNTLSLRLPWANRVQDESFSPTAASNCWNRAKECSSIYFRPTLLCHLNLKQYYQVCICSSISILPASEEVSAILSSFCSIYYTVQRFHQSSENWQGRIQSRIVAQSLQIEVHFHFNFLCSNLL